MNRKNLRMAAEFLRGKEEQLERHENLYKRQGAEKVRHALQAFIADPSARFKHLQLPPLNLLNWRSSQPIERIAAERPEVFREALARLWQTGNADDFWAVLDPALDLLDGVERGKFASVAARANLASYLLFVRDPARHPYFKSSYGGKGIRFIFGEAMDGRSPGKLLTEYTRRCEVLRESLGEEGVNLRDALDTQSALFLIVDDLLPTIGT
ncbi:MAG TPA: hypothetical protein VNT60_00580 [Deinococcales bacterium]|nr:hypothetical protein [Deinococcales bacterium]